MSEKCIDYKTNIQCIYYEWIGCGLENRCNLYQKEIPSLKYKPVWCRLQKKWWKSDEKKILSSFP